MKNSLSKIRNQINFNNNNNNNNSLMKSIGNFPSFKNNINFNFPVPNLLQNGGSKNAISNYNKYKASNNNNLNANEFK